VIDVYLEVGSKRTFAGAVEWPGWCRMGRDEASALAALVAYGERYGRVAQAAHLRLKSPADTSALTIVERTKGGSTTDFGAPETIPTGDERPFDAAELRRSQALLRAAWDAFDDAVASAQGKTLSTGPRGGGRELDRIVKHVLDADAGYLSSLGHRYKSDEGEAMNLQLAQLRKAIFEGLETALHGDIPAIGPRGGKRWPPRYYVRRSLWHVLDHAWEIEDRSASTT
jgi:hypothetical protein